MPLYRFTFEDGSTSSANPVYQSRDDSAIFTGEVLGAAKVERLPEPPEPVVIWEAPRMPKGYVVTYVGINTGTVHVTGTSRHEPQSCGALATRALAEIRAQEVRTSAVKGSVKIIDLSVFA